MKSLALVKSVLKTCNQWNFTGNQERKSHRDYIFDHVLSADNGESYVRFVYFNAKIIHDASKQKYINKMYAGSQKVGKPKHQRSLGARKPKSLHRIVNVG